MHIRKFPIGSIQANDLSSPDCRCSFVARSAYRGKRQTAHVSDRTTIFRIKQQARTQSRLHMHAAMLRKVWPEWLVENALVHRTKKGYNSSTPNATSQQASG